MPISLTTHVRPGIGADLLPFLPLFGLAQVLAHQQQAERQRLREGGREQLVEIVGRVTARLGVGVEHVAERVAHQHERIVVALPFAQQADLFVHRAAHQPR